MQFRPNFGLKLDPESVQKRNIKLIEILIEKMTPRGPETAPKKAPKSHFFYGVAVQDFSLRALQRPISLFDAVWDPFGVDFGSMLASLGTAISFVFRTFF